MRQISSRWTFLYKFILPGWFAFGFVRVAFWGRPWFGPNEIPFLVPLVVGTAFVFWMFWPLKKVSLFGDKLYISNFRTEIVVPLSEIVGVRGNVLTEPQRVSIQFRNPTEFGTKIVFLAQHRWFSFWSTHPIVDELIAIVNSQNTSAYLTPPPRD